MKRKAMIWLTAAPAVALLTIPVLAQETPAIRQDQEKPLMDDVSPPAARQEVPLPATPAAAKPPAGVAFQAAQKDGEVPASSINGIAVQNLKGESLGRVWDVVIGGGGRVTVIVGSGGFLGIGVKYVGVPYEELRISMPGQNGQRTAFLNVSKEELDKAPGYRRLEEVATQEKNGAARK